MAKKPTPKYKTPKAKTRIRYSSFVRKTITRLEGLAKARNHTYKKATLLKNEQDKQETLDNITKVKA